MKNKLVAFLACTMFVSTVMLSENITVSAFEYDTNAYMEEFYSKEVDYSLWDKFLKYDLCITDYDSLTDEEKELCEFIFETEQSSDKTLICERARRTLADDTNISERITLEQLEGAYGIWDNYATRKSGYQSYIHCVPDIRHLDGWDTYNEYWLDDERTSYVCFKSEEGTEMCDFMIYDNGESYTVKPQTMPYFDYIEKDDGTYFTSDKYLEYNGDYYYIKPDNTAVFIKSQYSRRSYYEKQAPIEKTVVIPEEVNGYPVVAIEEAAFRCACVTEVILPETIEFIDSVAFSECDYLKKINFPKRLKYIGDCAFAYNSSLKEINIDCPELMLSEYAFGLCQSITDLNINAKIVGERVFEKCISLENITFGENIEKISSKAFYRCSALQSVQFPSSLKYLGTGAFLDTGVKTVTIPSNVCIIGTLPVRTGIGTTSGIYVPATDPLTDDPICVFDHDCTIYGYVGTEGEYYADEWGLEFVEVEKVLGDTDMSGTVEIADAVRLQSYLTGKYKNIMETADINGDGIINVFDMVMLRQKLMEY